MRSRVLPCAAAALLVAVLSHAPAAAQNAAPSPGEDTARADGRFTLSAALGIPGLHQPGWLAEEYDRSYSVRAAVGYTLSHDLEAGLAYEAGHFDARAGRGATATVHAVSLTGAVLGARELPVRPFLEAGPSLVIYTDDGVGPDGGSSSTVAGATLAAGLRLRISGTLDGRGSASVLVADGPGSDSMRVFSGLHLGFTLGL